MQKVIIDTDPDTDFDDARALDVLHHLADQGEADILGVACSIPIAACAACAQAINWHHRRPDACRQTSCE
jgi:inosine-uridine nucleoside N-ribohydrolase